MSTLSVAAIQYGITWLDKDRNLDQLSTLIAEYFQQQPTADLFLLPETFSTGFCIDNKNIEENENGDVLRWLVQQANRHQCTFAGSVLVSHGDKKVNRFYWVHKDGSVEHYDKRHLFRMGNEQKYVIQGEQRKVITIKGVRILPLVCYDLRFPVWSRNQQDYDVMINVANWPGARRTIWDTLLKARAMENQCYVIGVNRVGDDGNGTGHSGGTAMYDYQGETIISAQDNQVQIIHHTFDIEQLNQFKQKFPAYLDGDKFELITK